MVKRSVFLIVIFAASLAGGQVSAPLKQRAPIVKIGKWVSSKAKPLDVAAKTGGAVKNLKAVGGVFRARAQSSEGSYTVNGYLRFGDSRHFKVDYFAHTLEPYSCSLVANGQQKFVRTGSKVNTIPVTQRVSRSVLPESQIVEAFQYDFSRLLFQGFTDGVDAWTPLIRAIYAPSNGYRCTLEERTSTINGRPVKSYRFRGKKGTGGSAGPQEFEIVIDGNRFLPVTVTQSWKDKNGKLWKAEWFAQYQFNVKFARSEWQL